jgi:hypothetical protein
MKMAFLVTHLKMKIPDEENITINSKGYISQLYKD